MAIQALAVATMTFSTIRSTHNADSMAPSALGDKYLEMAPYSVSKNLAVAHLALWLLLRVIVWAGPQELPSVAPIVEMEPFFVTGSQVKWRFAQIPGREILSSYPDPTTREYLQQLEDAQQMLDFILPKQFQAQFDVPEIIILCDNEVMSPTYEDILSLSSADDQWGLIESARQSKGAAQPFPNLKVVDKDRFALLVTNEGKSSSKEITLINIPHVRFLLDRRTPQLPPWLVIGIMNLYVELYTAKQSMTYSLPQQATDTSQQPIDFIYRFPPFVWISPEVSKTIKTGEAFFGRDTSDPTKLMSDLLTQEPPSEGIDRELWDSRSTLFVRWALDREHHVDHRNGSERSKAKTADNSGSQGFIIDGSNSPHRDAFWKFTALAAAGTVTDATFKECFGMSYSEAARQLSDYLPSAVEYPIDLLMERSADEVIPVLRDPSRAEISRIKGDWERMALKVVRKEYRDSASKHIKQALMRAYNKGPSDPRLLAVIGLLNCDIGEDIEASGFLEAAAQENVVGPRVYYELARIRYGELRAASNGPLGVAGVAHIIEPLEASRLQTPPLLESYELAAKVMAETPGALTRPQLDYIDSQRQFFPRELDLLYKVASLNDSSGFEAEASKLAEAGEQLSTTPRDRAQFSKLRAHAAQTTVAPDPGIGGR